MNSILTIRKRLNLTQAELASELGCSQGNVSFYERGQTVPPDTAKKLIELAASKGVTITYNDVYDDVAEQQKAA